MNYKGHNVEVLTATKKKVIDDATKPYDAFSEGPFKDSLMKMEGVFRKEAISYKVTSIRDFSDGDYHDTVKVETLHSVEK